MKGNQYNDTIRFTIFTTLTISSLLHNLFIVGVCMHATKLIGLFATSEEERLVQSGPLQSILCYHFLKHCEGFLPHYLVFVVDLLLQKVACSIFVHVRL